MSRGLRARPFATSPNSFTWLLMNTPIRWAGLDRPTKLRWGPKSKHNNSQVRLSRQMGICFTHQTPTGCGFGLVLTPG